MRLITRIRELVDDEANSARFGSAEQRDDFPSRMGYALLDINRVFARSRPLQDRQLLYDLQKLRASLVENMRVVRSNLLAVRGVLAVVGRAQSDGEMDGTYRPSGKARGYDD